MAGFVPDHVRAKQDPDAMVLYRSRRRLHVADAGLVAAKRDAMLQPPNPQWAIELVDARDLYATAVDAWRVARGLV